MPLESNTVILCLKNQKKKLLSKFKNTQYLKKIKPKLNNQTNYDPI